MLQKRKIQKDKIKPSACAPPFRWRLVWIRPSRVCALTYDVCDGQRELHYILTRLYACTHARMLVCILSRRNARNKERREEPPLSPPGPCLRPITRGVRPSSRLALACHYRYTARARMGPYGERSRPPAERSISLSLLAQAGTSSVMRCKSQLRAR
jgi:hypothetical protein